MTDDELYVMAMDGVRAVLELVGEDPDREGLADTPRRWVKAMVEMCGGLGRDADAELATTFSDQYDEVVLVTDLPFVSLCEHHLLPFTGTATIAYLPGERIVGLSKLPRLLHTLSRRPQVQERLTGQVTDSIMRVLGARGAAAQLRAHHTCMSCRGIRTSGTMVTNSIVGLMRDDVGLRSEFLAVSH